MARAIWRSVFSYLTTAAILVGLLYGLVFLENSFDFEDWRGMLRDAQFPAMHVFLSLLAAYWIYLVGRRLISFLPGILARFWRPKKAVADMDVE